MNEMISTGASVDRRIQSYGETGLLVQFDEGDVVSASESVFALNQRLRDMKLRGIQSTTPSYVSLLIIFDPSVLAPNHLASTLTKLLECSQAALASDTPITNSSAWCLPTLFVGEEDEDAVALRDELGLSWSEVVERFCTVSYRVNALGFLPGFTYLGGLPEALHCRRLTTPRARIPASSVAIAGQQAGIYPMDSPGGWRILGRLPFSIFDHSCSSPTLFSPNDRITFQPTSEPHFSELARAADNGELALDRLKQ